MSRRLDWLIEVTREELFTFGNRLPIRDGDSLDAGNTNPTTVSITRQLNRAVEKLALVTKFSQEKINVSLTLGVREYTLPAGWLDVMSVHHAGRRVRRTTQSGVDEQYPDWELGANSDELYRYLLRGTSQLVLTEPPTSSAAASPLNCVVVTQPTDMAVKASDYPDMLPDLYHGYLPIGAALSICNMDSANPSAQERKPYLQSEWDNGMLSLATLMRDRMGNDLDSPIQLNMIPAQPERPGPTA